MTKRSGDVSLQDVSMKVADFSAADCLDEISLVSAAAVAQQCIKRAGQTSDLIGPLLFLASQASGYMSGQTLVVDGGKTMTA